ncbi:hypothetical protein GCM10027594_20820 [Hymenobacter agri]
MTPTLPGLYFENRAGEVRKDPDGFLRTTWGSHQRTLPATQAVFENMLRALRQFGLSRILVDQTRMVPFTPEEQQWITREWMPRAVLGGYRYGAVVVSTNVLARLATAFITTAVQGLPLVYRSFDAEDEARRWLQQQPG